MDTSACDYNAKSELDSGWLIKPWGATRCVYFDDACEHWHARVIAGGFSSRHTHCSKLNRLASLSTVIVVTLWTGSDVVREIIQPGQFIDVPAGMVHRFSVVRSGSLWEVYRGSPCDPADIVRFDSNGIRDFLS